MAGQGWITGEGSERHAKTDAPGRPPRFFSLAVQVSDRLGAAARSGGLPAAKWLIAVRGCETCRFRYALKDKV
jgi:hypothetical protein